MEFNSTIHVLHDFFPKLWSHPLFSIIVALYTLILLYAPSFFLRICLSPVLNSTGIILLSLLRLGANERSEKESRILGFDVNERSEKESSYLESRVLDHKEQWLPVGGTNLTLHSSLVLESNSMESRFLDFVDQSQWHTINSGLDHQSSQTRVEFEPISNLEMECNQTTIEFKYDLGLESDLQDGHHKWALETNSTESSQTIKEETLTMEMDSKQVDTTMKFLEWNVRAPLEIIYEAYEGEEEEEDDDDYDDDDDRDYEKINGNDEVSNDKQAMDCEKYPSLSMYYPESESGSSSDGDFIMNENWEARESVFFKWEEEEREELIEISLDRYGKRSIEFFHAEEDNLIEIDIFPTKN